MGSRPSSGAPWSRACLSPPAGPAPGLEGPCCPPHCLPPAALPGHAQPHPLTGLCRQVGSSGRLRMPTCPSQQNMVPPCPLPWGGLGGAAQKVCGGERLNMGSICAAEGLGCLPWRRASALQTWHDLWPVVGVRDCPPWSGSRALSLGFGGDTGWGSGLSPQAEARVRSPSVLLSSLSA